MVKVSEIDNKQLLKQILKYRKILDQLMKEREARRAKGAPVAELYTPQELAAKKSASSAPKPAPSKSAAPAKSAGTASIEITQSELSASDFQLEIDVDEIERLRAEEEAEKAAKGGDEEEVRVTQLLQLTKDQIAELKKAAKKD